MIKVKIILPLFVIFSLSAADQFNSLDKAGDYYLKRADFQNAIKAWSKAKTMEPGNGSIVNKIGIAYTLWGRYDEALRVFDGLIEKQPGNARAYFNKGALFLRWNRFKEAISQFSQCIAMDPRYPEAHFHIAFAQQRMGNWESALEEYQKELNVNSISAKAWRGFLVSQTEVRLQKGETIGRRMISSSLVLVFLLLISILGWIYYFIQQKKPIISENVKIRI
jgi:tetratricopeptide (TPR) repeat protein